MITSLAELLDPIDVTEFFSNYYDQRPLYIRGDGQRFREVLTWEDLNRVLSLPLEGLDVHVSYKGPRVPRERFSHKANNMFGAYSLINHGQLTRFLRDGAMLSLRNLETYDPKISNVCRVIENELGGYAHAIAFAGWHKTKGFNTHWDAYDAFIVQVAGVKHWRIFEPTVRYPIEVPQQEPRFTSSSMPAWEDDLRPGDLLYIPRGWWHDAVPNEELSLHVTFGAQIATGMDIGKLFLRRLGDVELARRSLPRNSDDSTRTKHLNDLRTVMLDLVNDLNLEMTTQLNVATDSNRGRMSLPWAVLSGAHADEIPGTHWVHWLVPRTDLADLADGAVSIESCGQSYEYSADRAPLLKELKNKRKIRVSILRDKYGTDNADFMVSNLASIGAVSISDREEI